MDRGPSPVIDRWRLPARGWTPQLRNGRSVAFRCWRVLGKRRGGGLYSIIATARTREDAAAIGEKLMGPVASMFLLHDERWHDGGLQPHVQDSLPSQSSPSASAVSGAAP
jgi:hypothetical protein